MIQSGGAPWRDKSFLQMIGREKMGNESGKLLFVYGMGKFVALPGNGRHMKVCATAMPVLATAILIMARMRIRAVTGGD